MRVGDGRIDVRRCLVVGLSYVWPEDLGVVVGRGMVRLGERSSGGEEEWGRGRVHSKVVMVFLSVVCDWFFSVFLVFVFFPGFFWSFFWFCVFLHVFFVSCFFWSFFCVFVFFCFFFVFVLCFFWFLWDGRKAEEGKERQQSF